jgi:hypothetical protein
MIPDTSSSSSGAGGAGGGPSNPCGVDCSGFQAGQCEVAVCNTGQLPGPLNTCTVVPAPDGTTCDDGQFCTVSDFCNKGTCVGGTQNDCSTPHDGCSSVICYESSKSCSVTPVNDGAPCTPTSLCQVDGVCKVGTCMGAPKNCSSTPMAECNAVSCDPMTGECKGTPDSNKDGNPCTLTGDLCQVNKACLGGQCVGGTPKDCSLLNIQCQVGVCNAMNGVCGPTYAQVGTPCTHGLQACQTGSCDIKGVCVASTAPDGSACNDHDACTQTDTCSGGNCGGTPVAGCTRYFYEGFETCPDGWTLAGDWQCGAPTNTSPVTPLAGHGVLATQLAGLYHNLQPYNMCTATSPSIDLTLATSPQLSFWVWLSTHDPQDGFNLNASTDGGLTFQEVMTVTPAYPQMVNGEAAWTGDFSALGWQPYSADLTAYAGQSIILRFAFNSDITGVAPGVYIDEIVVAEPLESPLYITTTSPLPDGYVGKLYSVPITKVGGTSGSQWVKNTGGTNDGWLKVDMNTGVLSGMPSTMDIGPVSVTVHVDEPTLTSNFAEETFTFNIKPDVYYTSWEGSCAATGWTLTGDWKCGVPKTVGPATAYDGTQCIGTGMGQDYSDNDTWAGTTATSPPISLVSSQTPSLTFRMWIDTENGNDGANLEISTDNGMTYSVLNTVTPPYPMTIANEPAWNGHQSGLGWQLVQADLTPYAGQTIRLRFAFDSDSSNVFAGVFIDDFLVQ